MKKLNKRVSLVFGIIFFTFLFNLSSAFALTCTLRDTPCQANEECVFSLFQQTDSHVSQCGTPGYNYNVCCQEPGGILNATVKMENCNENLNESGVISLYKTSDSHAREYAEYDLLYHVCLNSSIGRIGCSYQSSCSPGEGLASLKQDSDSHVAEYSYYPIKICCGSPFKFKMWVDETRLFTIGRPELANIYVQNLGTETDSYNITFTKNATMNLIPANHLVSVSMPSYRIHSVQSGKVGNTFATITVLGPIDYGYVNFTVRSENNPLAYLRASIDITTGYPVSLPEFGLIELIELLLLACLILVVSYPSHFR